MRGTLVPSNLSQLLPLIEIAMKLASGLLLIAAPRSLARVLGLAPASEPFWPRLLGATLIGLSLASLLEAQYLPGKSLGLLGSTTINLSVAVGLGALLILGRAAPSKRGRSILWLITACLTILGLVEIVAAV